MKNCNIGMKRKLTSENASISQLRQEIIAKHKTYYPKDQH